MDWLQYSTVKDSAPLVLFSAFFMELEPAGLISSSRKKNAEPFPFEELLNVAHTLPLISHWPELVAQ
jgi:hypothetical protein